MDSKDPALFERQVKKHVGKGFLFTVLNNSPKSCWLQGVCLLKNQTWSVAEAMLAPWYLKSHFLLRGLEIRDL